MQRLRRACACIAPDQGSDYKVEGSDYKVEGSDYKVEGPSRLRLHLVQPRVRIRVDPRAVRLHRKQIRVRMLLVLRRERPLLHVVYRVLLAEPRGGAVLPLTSGMVKGKR